MAKIGLIIIMIFSFFIFLFWKLTNEKLKKKYGNKMWKNWVSRTYYWQGAIFVSCGFTALVVFILKWGKVLTF